MRKGQTKRVWTTEQKLYISIWMTTSWHEHRKENPLQLQSGDNAAEWIFYTNALRHIPIQYSQSTVLPLPLHLAKALEEYLFNV